MNAEPTLPARAVQRPRRVAGGLLPVGRVRLGWIGWAEVAVAGVLIALVWRPGNWYLAGGIALVALLLAVPIRHRSAIGWASTALRFLFRRRHGLLTPGLTATAPAARIRRPGVLQPSPVGRTTVAPRASGGLLTRTAPPPVARRPGSAVEVQDTESIAALLGTVVPGLTVSGTYSANGVPIGLVGVRNRWVVVLTVRSDQQLVARVGETDTLPLQVAVPLLDTAGIRLDSIQVVVLNSPGSAALPEQSAALASHLELLGGLPTAARRRVLVALRLDPLACRRAIDARGGGVEGAHRALAATAARAAAAFGEAGFEMTTLNATETAAAIAGVAGLHRPEAGTGASWTDRWTSMDVGPLSHRSFTVTGWGGRPGQNPLDQVGNIRARAVSTSINLTGDPIDPVLTASVRITASGQTELATAQRQLLRTARLLRLGLSAADGFQREAFLAGLPLGGPEVQR